MRRPTSRRKLLIGILCCIILIPFLIYSESNYRRSRIKNIRKRQINKKEISDGFVEQRAFHIKMMSQYGNISVKPGKTGCKMPDLKLNDPVFDQYFAKKIPIECKTLDWVYAWSGVLHFDVRATSQLGSFTCSCIPLTRKDEYSNTVGTAYNCTDGTHLTTDFTSVKCHARQGQPSYNTTLATIVPKDDVLRRVVETAGKTKEHLNVLMFGLDSVSRLAMIRKLPKTVKLFENLGGKFLLQYNVVGDGTPQNLLPMLCGKTEVEMPNTRRRFPIPTSNYVNVYPFIWNDFRKKGYVTLESQDAIITGAYQYRLNGFKEQPTDHYLRNYYVTAGERKSCIEGKPSYQVQFNYTLDLFETYYEAKKFAFAHSDLCHDNINACGAADDYFVWFLQYFKLKGYLSNTVIIIYSDHGARFSTAFKSFRNTPQGKLEERLPVYGILLPSWFQQKYPKAYRNFEINAKERLLTPFNIYGSLLRIVNNSFNDLDVEVDINNRQVSIFDSIPIERTCKHADVEPHWCACLDWQEVPLDDPTLLAATNAFIEVINNELSVTKDLCWNLTYSKLMTAQKYLPNNALLTFKQASGVDGFIGDFSDTMTLNVIIYQIKVQTTPGNAIYEVLISWNVERKVADVDLRQCSILTRYSENAKCVTNNKDLFHLRLYCVCQ